MISNNLQKAINDKNTTLVQSILLRQINSDRKMKIITLIDSAKYAANELSKSDIDLFKEDDGESHYVEEQSQWNRELWENLRIDFEYNFSCLKLERIVQVMEYLRSQGEPYFQVDESFNDGRSNASQPVQKDLGQKKDSPSSQSSPNRDYLIGGVSGGVVGGLAGKMLGYGLGSLVVGVAVGLAVVYLKNKKG